MDKQVTTSEIATKLGISRGTVSKALNNRSNIDKNTRRLIIETAAKMGYRKLDRDDEQTPAGKAGNTIALMIREARYGDTYWSFFIKSFEEETINEKYRFTINVISQEDEDLLKLPDNILAHPPAGIVTVGPFVKEYYAKLKPCGIPVVFVDTASDTTDSDILGDTLLMCNRENSFKLTSHLIKSGHKRFGYISSYTQCRSFEDRWRGFNDALKGSDLPLHDSLVFGRKEGEHITADNLSAWLSGVKELPTAFVCANDFFAIIARTVLMEMSLSVPRDIAICGFDNDPSHSILYPQLTTIDSRVQYVGRRAVQELLWRISNPDAPYELIKITSEIHYRDSTEGYVFS